MNNERKLTGFARDLKSSFPYCYGNVTQRGKADAGVTGVHPDRPGTVKPERPPRRNSMSATTVSSIGAGVTVNRVRATSPWVKLTRAMASAAAEFIARGAGTHFPRELASARMPRTGRKTIMHRQRGHRVPRRWPHLPR
jgi:hypothetical protein